MYEQSTSVVVDALKSSSTTIFDDATIQRILSLTTQGTTDTKVTFEEVISAGGQVTVGAGTEVAFIGTPANKQTTLFAPKDVPVVIFQTDGGVNATFADGPTTVQSGAGVADRVVVHSNGADMFVIADAKNTQITVGANDTVVGGAGNDTVVAGLGNSTVIGGTGYTIVELGGDDSDYNVTVVNGHAVVTNANTGVSTDISNAQFVQLDNGEALVFANDSLEAAVSFLYETTFARAADAQGLDFWFDRAREGVSLSDIADAFTRAAEFQDLATTTDTAFIQGAFQNTFNRAASADELAQWTASLSSGTTTRGDLLEYLVDTASQYLDGTLTGEVTLTGTITIVPGIIG